MGPSFPPGGRARRRHSLPLSAACAAAVVAVLGGGACRSNDPNIADVAEAVQRVAATATSDPPVRRTIPPATSAPGTSVGTTVPPATSTTMAGGDPAADEAAVRATIDRFWDAYFEAVGTSPVNPDLPALIDVVGSDARIDIRSAIVELRDAGLFVRPAPSSRFSRTTTEMLVYDDAAQVRECVLDDMHQVSMTDGSVQNDEIVTMHLKYMLKRFDGVWLIIRYDVTSEQPGGVPCL